MNKKTEIEAVDMNKPQFRKFSMKDISRCSELAAEEWAIVSASLSKEDAIKSTKVLINTSRKFCTWLEVVCISDNVIGFLFGRINSDYNMKNKIMAFFSMFALPIKVIIGRFGIAGIYKRPSKRFTFFKKLILNDIKVMRNHPKKTDGEINLFFVDSKYRGKGIGRMLMDRFIDNAKNKNAKVITAYTVQIGNWKFYETYGFKRYSTFDDDLTSYIKNENVKGFVYAIDL